MPSKNAQAKEAESHRCSTHCIDDNPGFACSSLASGNTKNGDRGNFCFGMARFGVDSRNWEIRTNWNEECVQHAGWEPGNLIERNGEDPFIGDSVGVTHGAELSVT